MQDELEASLQISEQEESEDELAGQVDHDIDDAAVRIARRVLQEMETAEDSKLRTLTGLLGHICAPGTASRRVCVFTAYLGTVYYLAAEIESQGMAYQLVHGGMRVEDRMRSLSMFVDVGAILVATKAVMTEAVALAEVTDLVLYDIPDHRAAIRQILGRFDRFGRKTQLTVHILIPSNVTSPIISGALELLHDVLSFPPEGEPVH